MRTVISERTRGARKVAGTEWPIMDLVEREQLAGRRPTWIVTRGLCNGVPDRATEHGTKRAALEDFEVG